MFKNESLMMSINAFKKNLDINICQFFLWLKIFSFNDAKFNIYVNALSK